MTPEEFNSRFLPYAQAVSERTGLDPRLVLAQAALETGYGKSAPNMNYFGIKSHGRAGGQMLQTSEFENGRMVSQPASFRGYESPEQSFQGYADFLLTNPRYKRVLAADGLENQIAAMAKSGYATDPNYGAKLASIAGVAGNGDMMRGGAGSDGLLGGAGNDMGGGPAMENEQGGLFGFLGDREQRARLGLALMGMSMHPNQGAMALASDTIERAQAARENQYAQAETAKAENRTLQYIQNLGTPQAQKALAYAQGTGDIAGALRMAMETSEPERGVVVGGSIVNPLTGEVIYQPENKPEFKRATPEEAAAYGVQAGQFGPDGRFYEIDVPQGMTIESDGQGGFRVVQGAGVGVGATKFTEGQSKDNVYVTRAMGALEVLDPIADQLTNLASRMASADPTGFIRMKIQSPEYQVARNAGDEFLQAILRKDTGAAITSSEQELYGVTYLPQPGDGSAVLKAKKEARQRAINAIKAGMSPAQLIAAESALRVGGALPSAAGSGTDFGGVTVGEGF